MKTEIVVHTKSPLDINKDQLIQWINQVCKKLKQRNIPFKKEKLTVAFVDKKEIIRLNYTFRKKKSPTDILSFSSSEDQIGELALCLPVVYENVPDGFSKTEWLYYLILHGLLHLLGFEHENGGAKAQKMYQLQDQVFFTLQKNIPKNIPNKKTKRL